MLNTNFETIDQAKKELNLRSSLLMKSDKPSSHALGRKLSHCTEDDPCDSGACPLCARTERIALIQEGMAYYNMGGDWRMVTTIDYAHAKSDNEMRNLDVKKRTFVSIKGLHDVVLMVLYLVPWTSITTRILTNG